MAAEPGVCGQPEASRTADAFYGLGSSSPKPRLSQLAAGQEIYPYLLRGITIDRAHQVWSAEITYIRLQTGFVSLVAVMAWFSR